MVGEKEQSNRTVNVRTRDNKVHGKFTLDGNFNFQFFNLNISIFNFNFKKVHGEFTLDAVVAKFNELASERIEKSEEHGWSEKVEEEVEKSKSSTPMSD